MLRVESMSVCGHCLSLAAVTALYTATRVAVHMHDGRLPITYRLEVVLRICTKSCGQRLSPGCRLLQKARKRPAWPVSRLPYRTDFVKGKCSRLTQGDEEST